MVHRGERRKGPAIPRRQVRPQPRFPIDRQAFLQLHRFIRPGSGQIRLLPALPLVVRPAEGGASHLAAGFRFQEIILEIVAPVGSQELQGGAAAAGPGDLADGGLNDPGQLPLGQVGAPHERPPLSRRRRGADLLLEPRGHPILAFQPDPMRLTPSVGHPRQALHHSLVEQLPGHRAVGRLPAVIQRHVLPGPVRLQEIGIFGPVQPLPHPVVQDQDVVRRSGAH